MRFFALNRYTAIIVKEANNIQQQILNQPRKFIFLYYNINAKWVYFEALLHLYFIVKSSCYISQIKDFLKSAPNERRGAQTSKYGISEIFLAYVDKIFLG